MHSKATGKRDVLFLEREPLGMRVSMMMVVFVMAMGQIGNSQVVDHM